MITINITQTNNIKAAIAWVEDLQIENSVKGRKPKPWWKGRIEGDIKILRKVNNGTNMNSQKVRNRTREMGQKRKKKTKKTGSQV